MIDKIAEFYQKAQMKAISQMAGATSTVIDEASFYDAGYMQTQIQRVQRELKRITDELTELLERNDDSGQGKERKAELLKQRERWLLHMVFLASNSFGNLEECVKLAEGCQWSFMACIQGMREYQAGRKAEAFRLLAAFYQEGKNSR